jgi:cytochrome P450
MGAMDATEPPALPPEVAARWDADTAGAADLLVGSGATGLRQLLPGMVVAFRNPDVRALASDPAVGNVGADLLAQMMSFIGYDEPRRGFVPVIANQVFSFNAPLHAPARRALTRQMTPSNVARFGALADRLLDELLDGVADGRPLDLGTDLAQRFAARFFGALVGMDADEVVEAQHLTEAMSAVFLNAPTPAQVARVSDAVERYVDLVATAAARTLAGPAPGTAIPVEPLAEELLAELAADLAAIDVPGVPATIGAFAAGNLFDGFHTAGVGIANALWALVEHPEVAERVRADRTLAAAAYDEATRLAPPLVLTNHHVQHDTALVPTGSTHEVALPAGTLVVLHWGAANRDPDVFDAPAAFDLDRSHQRLLTFGRGSHVCPGRSLSRFLGQRAIDAVLRRPWVLEPGGEGPTWIEGATVTQLATCPVRPTPRRSGRREPVASG